jgi:hypothetical protein
MITNNGIQYQENKCSYPDGFAIELWRLPQVDGQQPDLTVYLAETGGDFEIEQGPTELPSEIFDSFISEAKVKLQEWRDDWIANFPEQLEPRNDS